MPTMPQAAFPAAACSAPAAEPGSASAAAPGAPPATAPPVVSTSPAAEEQPPQQFHRMSWNDAAQWVLGRPLGLWPLLLEGALVARAKELVARDFTTVVEEVTALLGRALQVWAARELSAGGWVSRPVSHGGLGGSLPCWGGRCRYGGCHGMPRAVMHRYGVSQALGGFVLVMQLVMQLVMVVMLVVWGRHCRYGSPCELSAGGLMSHAVSRSGAEGLSVVGWAARWPGLHYLCSLQLARFRPVLDQRQHGSSAKAQFPQLVQRKGSQAWRNLPHAWVKCTPHSP